jgi:RimJ/RimL family protein N-acetyltransferase
MKTEFSVKNGILHISLETKRLIIRSITDEDEKAHIALLGDPKNMKTFWTGQTKAPEEARSNMKRRIGLWRNKDPFNLYSIIEKESRKYIGFACFIDRPDCKSEIAYIIDHRCQGKGFGYEMIDAVWNILLLDLISYCKVTNKPIPKEIIGITLTENIPSQKILLRVGFKKQKDEIYIHNRPRYSFFYPLKNINEEKSLTPRSKL